MLQFRVQLIVSRQERHVAEFLAPTVTELPSRGLFHIGFGMDLANSCFSPC